MEDKTKEKKYFLKKKTNKEEEKTKGMAQSKKHLGWKTKKTWTRKRGKRGEQFLKDKRIERKVILFFSSKKRKEIKKVFFLKRKDT